MTKSTTLPNDYRSVESIVAMENVSPNTFGAAGRIANGLLSLYRAGDQRKSKFYKQATASVSTLVKGGSTQYRCTFRSAEFYLTAAEAAVELGDMENARHYLTALMKKRYNSAIYSTYEAQILAMDQDARRQEIYNERFRELAFEGHRWFDLRRTTRPELTKTYEGTSYVLQKDDSRYTLRIPTAAIQANPNLASE